MPMADLGSVSIHYLRLGSDPGRGGEAPLVFVHGLATSLAFWMPAVQHLGEARPALLYDLRGHGRSSMPPRGYTPGRMAEDLKHLLDRLEIASAVVVGHSFGGSVALHLACQHPDRVRRLILADARLRGLQPRQAPRDWPHWPSLKDRLVRLGLDVHEDEKEGGYRILTEMARLQMRAAGGHEAIPQWLAGFFGGGTSTYAARRWLHLLDATTAWEDICRPETIERADLRALVKPTLAVYGELSPVLPTARALAEIWPHMILRIIPEAGHFFPMGQAERFARQMTEFLETA
jgi:pimeloyl-ACP methyl ester carboxylesterase